jgi:hypothetical protein
MMNTAVALKDDPVTYKIRRFGLVDLTTKGPWLYSRLKAKYPTVPDREFQGWLYGFEGSNECWFTCTDNAIALFQVVKERLSPVPTVVEQFVFVVDPKNIGHIDEGAFLYENMMMWAKGIGAREVLVQILSDVPNEVIEQRIGSLRLRKQFYAKVPA